jgi:hypothetical protein
LSDASARARSPYAISAPLRYTWGCIRGGKFGGKEKVGENMKPKAKKKKGPPIDYFATFKNAVSEAFAFLMADFGFKLVKINVILPECEIAYWNETTSVTIIYEWQSVLSVDVGRLKRSPEGIKKSESYSLDSLLLERCPDRNTSEYYCSQKDWSEGHIKWALHSYASDLKACGEDILAGNFSIFPALKKQAAKIIEEKNKKIFGA